MRNEKIIYDQVHGTIPVKGIFAEILDTHEMQRLRGIKQLGDAYLIFPGATHTRFEHCLGTYHLSTKMQEKLQIPDEDQMPLRVAGLLHDLCHAPFSHTLENVMEEITGFDHMDLARQLITGKIKTYRSEDQDLFGSQEPIGDILERNGIDPKTVCDIISIPATSDTELELLKNRLDKPKQYFPSKDYLHQIIHGPVDADQMDYLMRDAHHTGVSIGHIDSERIIYTMNIHNDRICIEEKGAPQAEGLMIQRSLMYSSVYFHPAAKTISRMTVKAVENSDLDLSEMYLWNDSDLTQRLIENGGPSSKIMRQLRSRRFYKRAMQVPPSKTNDELVSLLVKHQSRLKRSELEKEIADKAGVEEYEVCVEMPSNSILLSKIQIGKTDVSILSPDGKVTNLTKISPIAKQLQSRHPFGWSAMVACPPEHVEAVQKATSKIFGISL